MERGFLKKSGVAKFFDVSVSTVNRWIEKELLPAPIKPFGFRHPRWRIEDLEKAASNLPHPASAMHSDASSMPHSIDEAVKIFDLVYEDTASYRARVKEYKRLRHLYDIGEITERPERP